MRGAYGTFGMVAEMVSWCFLSGTSADNLEHGLEHVEGR